MTTSKIENNASGEKSPISDISTNPHFLDLKKVLFDGNRTVATLEEISSLAKKIAGPGYLDARTLVIKSMIDQKLIKLSEDESSFDVKI